jgi:ankyrin repeat protein
MERVRTMNRRHGLVVLVATLAMAAVWLAAPVFTADDSPVASAAKAGDLAGVRTLIEKRADVNAPQADGSTALLWAAYNSDVDMTRALLTAGAKVDAANRYGVTPLIQASRTGDVAIMDALLKAGAHIGLRHIEGETALMASARSGNVEAVRLLVSTGADINAQDSFQSQTALMWAAEDGHVEVVKALLAAGAAPNLKAHVTALTKREHADHPTGGFTAAMFAARNGHEDVLRALVAGGADLRLTNGDGATATIIAIVNDRFDLAAKLLDMGADANDGSLYYAVDMHDATTDMRARDGSLLRANHPNKLTSMDLITLLLDRGADPNKAVQGQLHSTSMCCGDTANASPFYRAAIASDVDVLKLLIARGAEIEWTPVEMKSETGESGGGGGAGRGANANVGRAALVVTMGGGRGAAFGAGPGFSREGPPPFREAGNRKPADALKVLLAAGANPDAKAPDGSYAIHSAADRGSLEMIRELASAGATIDARNKDGKTALELVEKKVADAASGGGRGGRGGAAAGGGGGGGGRGGEQAAKPEEVVGLLRELMGLPASTAKPEAKPADSTEKPAAPAAGDNQ